MKHIKIGGAMRPLHFSINALIEFEELTQLDITNVEHRSKIGSIKNIRALAFVSLKHGHKNETGNFPDLTLEKVGDWLDKKTISVITDAFIDDSSTGEEDSAGEVEEEDKKKQTGAISEPSPSVA